MENLEQAVQQVTEKLDGFVDEQLKPIQERLLSLEERGTEPNAEAVKDLEKRLEDAERGHGAIQEEMRLLKVSAGLLQPKQTLEELAREHAGTIVHAMLGMPTGEAIKVLNQRGSLLGLFDGSVVVQAADSSLFPAGELPPDVLTSFLDYGFENNALLSICTTRPMRANAAHLDRLDIAARKTRVQGELTDTPPQAGTTTSGRRTLNTVATSLPEDISLQWLEDNIEGPRGEQTIAARLARAFVNDHNDLSWNGDTTDAGGDADFLNINEGLFRLNVLDSNRNTPYDATGDTTAVEVLNSHLRSQPSAYRTGLGNTFWFEPGFVQTYMDEVAARETAGGDAVLADGFPMVRYFGIPLVAERNMPKANGWLGPRADIVWGVQRSVRIDSEYKPRKAGVEYTIHARTDIEYGGSEVHVVAENIPAGLTG